jgi:hypothetical protein
MRFSLEALQAGPGDSLIVHYGDPPLFILVDGGPKPTYSKVLRKRLDALKDKWQDMDTQKLIIDLLLISHIDDDHIAGIVELLSDMCTREAVGPLPYLIQTVWHNSFDDLIGRGADALQRKLASAATSPPGHRHQPAMLSAGVVASVNQGREIRRLARQLGIPLNSGFESLILATDDRPATLEIAAGLRLRVLGPTEGRLRALQSHWEKMVRRLQDSETNDARLVEYVDRSVSNLSSIIVLLEAKVGQDTKRMLLTGDARGDDLLEMIDEYQLAPGGRLHVDVFKIPHHGSDRNADPKLFELVTADHYVISANGAHGNPDPPLIKWILDARRGDKFKIHMTNAVMVDPKTGQDIAAEVRGIMTTTPHTGGEIVWPSAGQASVTIDLDSAQPVDY